MEASTPRRMVIRRTTPMGDRRRRVVVDDSETRRNGTTVKPERTHPPRRYSAAAQREAQPRLFECIPIRRWTLAVWFLLGNTFAVAHATIDVLCDQATQWGWTADLSALRMDGPQNLSRATQTLTFLLCAVYCALTVQFRRHRIDDYRGRYRVWYSAASLATLLSFNATSNLASLPTQILVQATKRLGLAGQAWPSAVICLFTLPLLIRLIVEIWSCRGAVWTLIASFLLFCVSRSLPHVSGDAEVRHLATGLTQLLASQWLLFALVLNARYVFLDAQGELPAAPRLSFRRLRRAKASDNVASGQADSPEKTPIERASATETAAKASSVASAPPQASPVKREMPPTDDQHDVEDDDDEDEQTLSMSRADRKRQRKEQQKTRRAA